MARPRVFISSTYYDLKQTRENLDQFLTGLGYDTVRNEHGDIPYGNKEELETLIKEKPFTRIAEQYGVSERGF